MDSGINNGSQPYKNSGLVPEPTESETLKSTESTGSPLNRSPNQIEEGSDSGPYDYEFSALNKADEIQEIRGDVILRVFSATGVAL